MSSLNEGARIILRARALMENRGYGWSKAIDRAAETLEHDNADDDRTGMDRDGRPALVGKGVRGQSANEL